MGYYTNFEITVEKADEHHLCSFASMVMEKASIGLYKEGNDFSVNAKWYDWYEHMIDISKKLPNIEIYISGEGEGEEDIWEAIIHNGKGIKKKAIITYPTIDISEIK